MDFNNMKRTASTLIMGIEPPTNVSTTFVKWSDKTKSSARSKPKVLFYAASENGRSNDYNSTKSGTADELSREQSMGVSLVQTESEDDSEQVYSRKGFVITCLCFCVGFRNVMKFPMTVYTHGSSFIFAYVVMIFLIGLPCIYFEIGLGQFTSSGPIGYWGFCPLFQGVGVAIVMIDTLIAVAYNQITAYCLFYVLTSIGWTRKGQTNKCNANSTDTYNQTLSLSNLVGYVYYRDNVEEHKHFNFKVFLCLIGSWVLVGAYIMMGKSKKIFGPIIFTVFIGAYAIMIVLLVHSSSLDGSFDGVAEYMRPKFESLLTLEIWKDAAIETYFGFYLQGVYAVIASYNNIHCEFFGDVIIIAFLELISNILPGFVVFSYLGALSKQCGSEVFDWTDHRHDLEVAYVIIPSAIRTTSDPAVWGFFFFLILYILTITTQIVLVQTVITAFKDRYPGLGILGGYITFLVCLILFLISIPFNREGGLDLFLAVSKKSTGLNSLFLQAISFIALSWVYGADNFLDDIQFMRGKQHILNIIPWSCMRMFLFFTWKYISPAFLILMIIVGFENPFKPGEQLRLTVAKIVVQWLPIAVVVLSVIVKLCRSEGSLMQRIRSKARPSESWGPAHPKKTTLWKKTYSAAVLAEVERISQRRRIEDIARREDRGCDAIDTMTIVAENNN